MIKGIPNFLQVSSFKQTKSCQTHENRFYLFKKKKNKTTTIRDNERHDDTTLN